MTDFVVHGHIIVVLLVFIKNFWSSGILLNETQKKPNVS